MWKLEDGVTYSALSSFMECREQFALKYIDGYTPKRVSIPLEFGTVMHAGIEHQFNYSTPQECIGVIADKYMAFRTKTALNSRERDTLDTLITAAKVTFPLYCEFWHEDDQAIHWIQREKQFDIPYKLMTADGVRDLRLRGMRDGVFRLPGSNALGVFETKNKSRISEIEIMEGLKSDMQTMFYMFATSLEMNEIPRHVTYNIIRREVRRLQAGREPLTTFAKRLGDDIKKRPRHYFMRYEISVIPQELQEFVKYNLNPLLCEFVWWWDNVKKNPVGKGRFQSMYHYLNSNALMGKYGKADVWDLIVNNNPRQFIIRSEPFPELAKSFLDT